MTPDLQIKIVEWLDPGAARGDELRATWARLEIIIGEHKATRVMDESSARSVRDAIYVPVYPLAEWIASHWWFLLYERTEARPGFDRRHCMRYAGDGFAFPPLRLVSDGIRCTIEAEPKTFPNAGIQFLETFASSVNQDQALEELKRFVSSVCTRLDERNIRGSLLQQDWAAICSADKDEIDFCRAIASMGSDPYAIDADEAEVVIAARKKVSGELLWNDLTEAASQSTLDSCVSWLNEATSQLHQVTKFEPKVSCHDLNGASSADKLAGWQQGYKGARSLWDSGKLGAESGSGQFDWSRLIKRWDEPSWQETHQVNAAPVKAIHALLEPGKHSFSLVVPAGKSTRKESQAFLLARALGEHLWHDSAAGSHSMLTASQSWRQQRSRAFAAELLAPSTDIRRQISGSIVTNEEVDELAEHYGVSDWLIRHQLRNHELATVRD